MAARRTLRDQAGETLVEVMMTVAIAGMAMVAVLGALGTAMRLSDTNEGSADANVALVAAAEAVKAYKPAWAICDIWFLPLTASYQPALDAIATDWAPITLNVTDATCRTVNGVQKAFVTVTATAPGGSRAASTQVVRRSIS